jgi:primosomal protein N'
MLQQGFNSQNTEPENMSFSLKIAAFGAFLALSAPLSNAATIIDDDGAALTLKTASAKTEYIIDGAAWRCHGTECSSPHVVSQPAIYACMHAAEEMGTITAFTFQGEALSPDKLAKCNTHAKG